jgi:hypothetical protein
LRCFCLSLACFSCPPLLPLFLASLLHFSPASLSCPPFFPLFLASLSCLSCLPPPFPLYLSLLPLSLASSPFPPSRWRLITLTNR